MLRSIDVLIGLAVIMLALSMAVTVITQFVITLLNRRGRHLRRGLVDLLGLLDPALTGKIANRIATVVLTHPLLSATGKRLGSVVHREEFTKLLLHLAAGDDKRLGADDRGILKEALRANGVTDPAATLKKGMETGQPRWGPLHQSAPQSGGPLLVQLTRAPAPAPIGAGRQGRPAACGPARRGSRSQRRWCGKDGQASRRRWRSQGRRLRRWNAFAKRYRAEKMRPQAARLLLLLAALSRETNLALGGYGADEGAATHRC